MTEIRIETERLILRPTTLEDFPRWAEFQADPEATRFIGGPKTPAETWRIMATVAGAWSLTGVAMFSLIERDAGRGEEAALPAALEPLDARVHPGRFEARPEQRAAERPVHEVFSLNAVDQVLYFTSAHAQQLGKTRHPWVLKDISSDEVLETGFIEAVGVAL